MNLNAWDWIVISTSGGKDSQAMMAMMVRMAREQGVLDKVVAVHADLGRVEWAGTAALAHRHAMRHGIQFRKVRRDEDLLDHIERRGKFPSPTARYCTSDHKRDQIAKVYTQLARETRDAWGSDWRQVRILSCMGFRAQESPARAKRKVLQVNKRQSNGKREVTDWLPIHDWLETRVWEEIRTSGTDHHPAYDWGMPRLSCCFCIFAPRSALMIAGQRNPELLAEYVRVEKASGHQFRGEPGKTGSYETGPLALTEIKEALDRGDTFGPVGEWGNQ